jgi:glycosyltransferase involved in cell wall biosynthesis
MKIAIVHDYLAEYGGAERVVEAFHEIWPDAPLYTAFVDWKRLGKHAQRFRNWNIKTSWVQHFPLVKKFISPLRFLAPTIWESFDLSGFDVVLTSSGWFIPRGVNAGRRNSKGDAFKATPLRGIPMQICYIHHPPRNLYGYATGSNLQKYWPVRLYTIFINFFLRNYDFKTAKKVDYFIANSKETARRVEKFYRRDSTVIYPPIEILDTGQKAMSKAKKLSPALCHLSNKSYYLSVGRLSWMKRIDLIIKACNQLKKPLKIVGVGNEEEALKKIAACPPSISAEGASGRGPTVEFLGSVSDTELAELYINAKALIFSALDEDFGMVPVEAMAYGTPVIGLSQGGVKETVVDARSASSGQGATGVLFDEPTVGSLINAIRRFEKLSKGKNWKQECMKQAEKFSKEGFRRKLRAFVMEKLPS